MTLGELEELLFDITLTPGCCYLWSNRKRTAKTGVCDALKNAFKYCMPEARPVRYNSDLTPRQYEHLQIALLILWKKAKEENTHHLYCSRNPGEAITIRHEIAQALFEYAFNNEILTCGQKNMGHWCCLTPGIEIHGIDDFAGCSVYEIKPIARYTPYDLMLELDQTGCNLIAVEDMIFSLQTTFSLKHPYKTGSALLSQKAVARLLKHEDFKRIYKHKAFPQIEHYKKAKDTIRGKQNLIELTRSLVDTLKYSKTDATATTAAINNYATAVIQYPVRAKGAFLQLIIPGVEHTVGSLINGFFAQLRRQLPTDIDFSDPAYTPKCIGEICSLLTSMLDQLELMEEVQNMPAVSTTPATRESPSENQPGLSVRTVTL